MGSLINGEACQTGKIVSPRLLVGVLLLCSTLGGCAAMTNPVADAIPVSRLPSEVIGRRREEERTIPLTLLRQKPPDVYRLDSGDLLGIWIEGILGEKGQPPPLRLPEQGNIPPAFGYPVGVREDGTIDLPYIEPLKVKGDTVAEVRDAIHKAYTVDRHILQMGRDRIIVSLMRPRQYHILVVRQDTGAVSLGGTGISTAGGLVGQTKRGSGYVLDLPAYENDVLNALARTGGFPGLDAHNEVTIERGSFKEGMEIQTTVQNCAQRLGASSGRGSDVYVRIPLRMRPGEKPPFTAEDVILRTGDILFIEARDTEVFYTGGLLQSGQHALPRDYSIDVVEALALVNGSLINGALNVNNLAGNVLEPGIGFPSPSLVTILRRTPGGGQIPIRISLNRALRDPRERVLIQPGDVLILQETLAESLTRYFTEVYHLSLVNPFSNSKNLIGTNSLSVP